MFEKCPAFFFKVRTYFSLKPLNLMSSSNRKRGIVREDLQNSTSLKLHRFDWVVVDPRFAYKEWMSSVYGTEVLV
jgi:hypothetical protein